MDATATGGYPPSYRSFESSLLRPTSSLYPSHPHHQFSTVTSNAASKRFGLALPDSTSTSPLLPTRRESLGSTASNSTAAPVVLTNAGYTQQAPQPNVPSLGTRIPATSGLKRSTPSLHSTIQTAVSQLRPPTTCKTGQTHSPPPSTSGSGPNQVSTNSLTFPVATAASQLPGLQSSSFSSAPPSSSTCSSSPSFSSAAQQPDSTSQLRFNSRPAAHAQRSSSFKHATNPYNGIAQSTGSSSLAPSSSNVPTSSSLPPINSFAMLRKPMTASSTQLGKQNCSFSRLIIGLG